MIGDARTMRIDRLTWGGLGIVVFGWIVLIADMTVSESMLRAGNLVAVISLRSDIVTIAQTLVLSGFGIALMGSLRSGFGALSHFFETVLQRSAPAKAAPPPPLVEPPEPEVPLPAAGTGPAPGTYGASGERALATSPIRPVPAAYQAMTERPVPAPAVKDRNYVILADGSVEVETLLGTRIFASLDEARDFIR